MPRRAYARLCPLSMALDQVGDRWTLQIVYALLGGPKRYADLKLFLTGAGSNVLSDRLRRLADARIVGRTTGDRPGSETTYHLTERGRALGPAIQSLARWGLPLLTLTGPISAEGPEREVFDQQWAIADPGLVADETYQWTVDDVQFELAVSGRSVTRTRGPARAPVVELVTTSATLDEILAGQRTTADAVRSGDLVLSGPADAIRRMFVVIGLPANLFQA